MNKQTAFSGLIVTLLLMVAIVLPSSVFATESATGITFTATGQNMWGAGAASTIDQHFTLFTLPWDFGPYQNRSVVSLLGEDYGYDIYGKSTGSIGLYFDVDGTAGGIDITYGGTVTFDYPDPSTFRKGNEVIIRTSFAETQKHILASAPRLMSDLYLAGYITLDAYLKILFAGNPTDIMNLNFDSREHAEPASPYYPNLGFSLFNIDSGLEPDNPSRLEIFYPQSFTETSVSYELPYVLPDELTDAIGISGSIDLPKLQIDADMEADGSLLKASGEDQFIGLSADLDSYLPIPEPYNLAISGSTSGSLEGIVNYSAGYDVFNLMLGLDVYERQEFSFSPTVMVTMAFTNSADGLPLDVSLCVTGRGAGSAGCIWETASSRSFEVGKDLHVIYPADPSPDAVKVTPTLSLSNSFRNKTWIHFEEPLTFELLKASAAVEPIELVPELCIPAVTATLCNYLDAECWWSGNCYCWSQTITPEICTPAIGFSGINLELGPLWDYTLASELQQQDLTAFDSTWQLGGFLPQNGNIFDMVPGSCPTAYDGSLLLDEDTVESGALTSTEVTGNQRTFSVYSQGIKGILTITDAANGNYTYTPNLNANGVDTVRFRVHDNTVLNCDSNIATVTITIAPVNDSPTNILLSRNVVAQGSATGTVVGTLTATDADAGDVFAFSLPDNAAGRFRITGSKLEVDNGGLLDYSSSTQHSITVRVMDSGGSTYDKSFTINVRTIPVAGNGVLTITEDTPAGGGTLSATDQDGEGRTFSLVSNGQKGTAVITNTSTGAYYYAPFPNANGTDTFSFRAIDTSGFSSNTATVTVTINPVNDPPSNLSISTVLTGPPDTTEEKLTASDGMAFDNFGSSIAASGDYVIVGAPNDDIFGGDSGSAYIYEYGTGGTFIQKKLVPSDGASGNNFGYSVSIADTYAIVGAFNVMSYVQTSPIGCGILWLEPCYGDRPTGAAYVFERNSSSGIWEQKAKLFASDREDGDRFGYSVGISGNYAIVGAPSAEVGFWFPDSEGAAYIFERLGATWNQRGILTASDYAGKDQFGYSVGISGSTAIVGAPYKDKNWWYSQFEAGTAYIFERGGGSWYQQAVLNASDRNNDDYFGLSVAISGNVAVIGAHGDDDRGSSSGSAYVFTREPDYSWSQKKVTASDGASGDGFGKSVAINGSNIIVGASSNDDLGSNSGSVYLFARDASGALSQTRKINPSDGYASDQFGSSVAVSRHYAVAGAVYDDDRGADSGSAYVYELTPVYVMEGLHHGSPAVTSPGGSETGTLVGTIDVIDPDLNNPDAKDTFSFSLTDDAGGRFMIVGDQLEVSASGLIDYEANREHSVRIRVTDIGGLSHERTFLVHVKNINEAPVAENTAFTTNEDTILSSSLSASDPNGDSLTYSIIASPSKGSLIIDDTATGAFTYTPYANMTGTDSFLFVVSDGLAYSNSAGAVITIVPLNDTPLAVTLAGETIMDDVSGAAGDMFGSSVSIYGSHAVIGAKGNGLRGQNSGAAYIMERGNDGVWTKIQEIYGSSAGDFSGSSVSVSGDYAIVGAYGEDWMSASDAGALHVYERSGGSWTEKTTLHAPDYAVQDYFGFSSALSGDHAIAGAPGRDDNGDGSGSAYIFERSPSGVWAFSQKLLPADSAAGDTFGHAVSVSGDMAVVGAYGGADNGVYSGAAYIFERGSDGIWLEKQKLLASDGAAGDSFGSTVSISGSYAVIGAPYHIFRGMAGSGAAYVFERSADGTWTEVSKLTSSDAAEGDWFGSSVSVTGDSVVVGAQKDDDRGSAYLFRRSPGGAWTESQKLVASDSASGDRFGSSVSISDRTILTGAYLADGLNADSGAVYFYDIGHEVAENSPAGKYIGTLSGLDTDNGETYTFTLVDDAGGRFSISGNQLLVADGSLLDYEKATSHSIEILATDSGGKSLSQTLNIYVTDVDDGIVSKIIINPTSPSSLVAGTDTSGIWKSTDGGGSWTAPALQPSNKFIRDLVMNPTNHAVLYAATYGSGIFKSQDFGDTWYVCANTGLGNLNATSLAIDQTGKLYAGTEGGIYTSTDCDTWNATDNSLPASASSPPASIVIDPAVSSNVYTGLDGAGVYRSANSGTNWSPANGTNPSDLKNLRVKALARSSSGTLYAGTYGGGVYTSTDNGDTWSVCDTATMTNKNVISLTIDGSGKLYAGTEDGVFASDNDCVTWQAMSAGLP